MSAGSTCWLHLAGQEHVAKHPVGVVRDHGEVIPADRICALREVREDLLDPDGIVDFGQVNVGWIRS